MSGRSLLISVIVIVLLSSMFGAGAFAARETGTFVAPEGAWDECEEPPCDPEYPDRVIAGIAEWYNDRVCVDDALCALPAACENLECVPPLICTPGEPGCEQLPTCVVEGPTECTTRTACVGDECPTPEGVQGARVSALYDEGVGLGVIVKLYALGYTNEQILERHLDEELGWGEWIGSGHLGSTDRDLLKGVSVGKIMSQFPGEEDPAAGDGTGEKIKNANGNNGVGNDGNNGGGNDGNNGGGNGGGNSGGNGGGNSGGKKEK